MKENRRSIFAVVGFIVLVFLFKDVIKGAWFNLKNKYFPCQDPIQYSLGNFDERFGVSQKEFLDALFLAEKIWEEPVGKDLFTYVPGGVLKVNLIYDNRQESTKQLQALDKVLDSSKESYDTLKDEYDSLKTEYQNDKSEFDSMVESFNSRKAIFEKSANYWNTHGGANQSEYNRLEKERDVLNQEAEELNDLQTGLNNKINEINTLATSLNTLAQKLNLNVSKFNEIGESQGEEFEEGVYEKGPNGTLINIYQFENQAKLIRVLAHELGHALGLEHVEDKEAIMYRLNNGVNQKLTESDLVAIRNKCDIK